MLDTQTTQTQIWSNGHSWVTLVVILLFINSKYKTQKFYLTIRPFLRHRNRVMKWKTLLTSSSVVKYNQAWKHDTLLNNLIIIIIVIITPIFSLFYLWLASLCFTLYFSHCFSPCSPYFMVDSKFTVRSEFPHWRINTVLSYFISSLLVYIVKKY